MSQRVEEIKPQQFAVVDECSINLSTNIDKIIAEEGSKPVIETEKTYNKGISIVAAITANQELVYQIKENRMNSKEFKDFLFFLKRDRDQYLNSSDQLELVLDNALYHHSNTTKEKADELDIDFHFQPSYSPEVNAVEELWRQLREFLRNELFYRIEELRMAVQEFLFNNRFVNINVSRYFT